MKNKVGILFSKEDLNFKKDSFPNKSNVLFVTGLSGSGKSVLSEKLAKEYGATIFQPEWLIHSKHVPKEFEAFFENYKSKYPETIPLIESKWNNCHTEDENTLLKKYINLFLQSFLENVEDDKLYIVEGLQLFTLIDFEKIKDFPFVVKRTSSIKCLNQRLKRDLKKRKSIKEKTTYFFKAIKQSRLYQFKHRKSLNKFIAKLTKTNS